MSEHDYDNSKLLVLIEDGIEPLKLIITWPKVWFDYRDLLEGVDIRRLHAGLEFTEEWARVSGVDIDLIEKWAPVLFENGLILDEGTVSSIAAAYCRYRGLTVLGSVAPVDA